MGTMAANEFDVGGDTLQVDTTILGLSHQEAMTKVCYVFRAEVLRDLLNRKYPSSIDFNSEFIPSAVGEYNVQASLFNDYWEANGTMKSFFDANLGLTDQVPCIRDYPAHTLELLADLWSSGVTEDVMLLGANPKILGRRVQ